MLWLIFQFFLNFSSNFLNKKNQLMIENYFLDFLGENALLVSIFWVDSHFGP